MFKSISSIFKQLIEGDDLTKNPNEDPNLAIAALLCEVAKADQQVDEEEQIAKIHLLQKITNSTEAEAQLLLDRATEQTNQSVSLYDFTSQLQSTSRETRIDIIQAMWEVAYTDSHLDPFEEAVIRKVAELLYVDHHDFIKTKLTVQGTIL
jgi:uncharacterized tellurite resistance protein B-like protein